MLVQDVASVLELRLSTRENPVTLQELEQDYGVTPQSMTAALVEGRVQGWLCENAGTVVGFAMGDPATGEVLVLAVRPGHERQGIGRRLLQAVVDALRAQGHRSIWLLSNPDPGTRAYGFYRKLGWAATGRMVREDEIMKLADGAMPGRGGTASDR